MKERPILFSGPMVKAILEGRKTQTRRVLKPQPQARATGYFAWQSSRLKAFDLPEGFVNTSERALRDILILASPYGQVDDRLWVRETWWCSPNHLNRNSVSYRQVVATACGEEAAKRNTWKPSIFMPRWASRLLLEITAIRAQRLQEITEEDAQAESPPCFDTSEGLAPTHSAAYHFRYHFRKLWDSLNAKRGYGWDTNPWCWCLSFKRVD